MNGRASRWAGRARLGDPRMCAPGRGGSARAAFAHRQALRAVAGVTFTLGLAGCIEDVDSLADPAMPVDPSEVDAAMLAEEPDAEPLDVGEHEDAAAADMSVWFEDARVLGDAGDALPDAAGDEGVDAETDASTELPTDPSQCLELMGRGDFEAYNACCEAFGWPPACIAWGPPVPPSMPEEVRT